MSAILRIVDASANRASEGLRVVEDVARFVFDNGPLAARIREVRHTVRETLGAWDARLLEARWSCGDVGAPHPEKPSLARNGVRALVAANWKRAQEALRSLEETLAASGQGLLAGRMARLRFETYVLEQELHAKFWCELADGFYGILTEKFCRGRGVVATARMLLEAGVRVLQYREKTSEKTLGQMWRECQELRSLTRDHGAQLIVNDAVDVALAVDADGVHVGQDDLPVSVVRNLVGHRLVGLSTHSPQQARAALAAGVDYLGIGPVYSTQTKENVCAPVGLEYVRFAREHVPLPWVAIGGIKERNLGEVMRAGATRVCLVTEVLEADSPAALVRRIQSALLRKDGERGEEFEGRESRHAAWGCPAGNRDAAHAVGAGAGASC